MVLTGRESGERSLRCEVCKFWVLFEEPGDL